MIDIEKLDNMPMREGMRVHHGWRNWGYAHEWNIAKRILNSHTGKPFDVAYSNFCHKIKPYHDKSVFLNKFSSKRYYNANYYVDDDGLIQKVVKDKYKQEIAIISNDYKVVKVHKETGHLRDLFYEKWEKKIVTHEMRNASGAIIRIFEHKENTNNFLGYQYKAKYYLADEKDFVEKVISGSKQIFTSKNDYRYIRYWSNWRKTYKAKQRKLKLEKSLALESKFREIVNAKKLKDKEKNDMIIIKHGFCPKTSFRNFI